MNCYEPEGRKIAGTANQRYCGSLEGLREAMAEGVILEGWGARISGARPDLLVDLGGIQGVIPHDEGALGMEDGSTRDIALLTRVGKPVCFVVTGFEELAEIHIAHAAFFRQLRDGQFWVGKVRFHPFHGGGDFALAGAHGAQLVYTLLQVGDDGV